MNASIDQQTPSPQNQRNIWLLYLICGLFWAHFFGAVLVPFYTTWAGLSLKHVFLLNAWFMLCCFLLEVPTGTVADYLGRKVSIALSGLVAVAGALVYVSAPSLPRFIMAEFLLATSFTLQSGAVEALAYDTLKIGGGESSLGSKVLARLEAWKLGGINVGLLIGSAIAVKWGVTAPMTAYAIPALLVFFLALFLSEIKSESTVSQKPKYLDILREGGRYFVSHPDLRRWSWEMALTNALTWSVIWLCQPVLMKGGMSLAWLGVVQAAACFAEILYLTNVGTLERWCGSKERLINVSALITGATMLMLSFTAKLPFTIPLLILAFAFGLTRVAVYGALLNAKIPSDKRATVLSYVSMWRTLGIVVMNPLVGWLADWSLAGVLGMLGMSLIVLAWIMHRQSESRLLQPSK